MFTLIVFMFTLIGRELLQGLEMQTHSWTVDKQYLDTFSRYFVRFLLECFEQNTLKS